MWVWCISRSVCGWMCVSAVCVSNMKSCDWQVSAPCAGNLLSNSCRLTSIFSVASSWVPLFCGSGRPLTGTCMWEQLTHDGHRDFKEGRGLGPAHHCTLWSCNFPANVHKPPVNNGIQETESLCGRVLWSGISGQKGGRLMKCVFAPLCLNSASCCLPFNANWVKVQTKQLLIGMISPA